MGVVLRRVGTLAAVLFVVATGSAQATSFDVTSTLDTGGTCTATPTACTLRQAIASANAHTGADIIQFNSGLGTIKPGSALPAITGQTDIEGNGVELDGTNAGASVTGLTFASGSGSSTVASLAIDRFSADGIFITGSDFTKVRSCVIGSDSVGDTRRGNGAAGIAVTASEGVHIGDFANNFGNGNTIVGNGGQGIDLSATAASAAIELNQIGISGFTPNSNGGDGIRLSGPSNTVGDIGLGNTIVGQRRRRDPDHRNVGRREPDRRKPHRHRCRRFDSGQSGRRGRGRRPRWATSSAAPPSEPAT